MGGENAVAFGLAPTYPASQLVKLAQAEPIGVLNDHERSVGHVHTYLDNGGGYHHIRFAPGEGRHGGFLLRPLHLTVKQRNPQIGKHGLL